MKNKKMAVQLFWACASWAVLLVSMNWLFNHGLEEVETAVVATGQMIVAKAYVQYHWPRFVAVPFTMMSLTLSLLTLDIKPLRERRRI